MRIFEHKYIPFNFNKQKQNELAFMKIDITEKYGVGVWQQHFAVYVEIVNYMFFNDFLVKNLEKYVKYFETSKEFMDNILHNYDLFYISDGKYKSKYIDESMNILEEKQRQAATGGQNAWIIKNFCEYYKEIFGHEIKLSYREGQLLKKLNTVHNFYDQLYNIIERLISGLYRQGAPQSVLMSRPSTQADTSVIHEE